MRRQNGFTIIELLVALTLTVIVGVLIVIQKNDIDASHRDDQRKTAVNALYYGLKEGYYPSAKSYPTSINAKTLPYILPESFKTIGDEVYKIRYIGLNCRDGSCQGFDIKVKLEKEAEYTKSS